MFAALLSLTRPLFAHNLELPPVIAENPNALPPIWALIVMFCLWKWTNRDRGPEVSVQTLYEPPAGLTPAEAATLVDKQLMSRDITATMVDLARRGYISIREKNEMLLGRDVKDYALTLLKSRSSWEPTLAEHELEVLDTLFPLDAMVDGVINTETTLSFASASFPAALPRIRAEIYRAMKKKGILANIQADSLPTVVGCLIVIAAPFVWLESQGLLQMDLHRGILKATIMLTMLPVTYFAHQLAPKTRRGTQIRAACMSFRDFLERTDGDRLRRLPPETFEKFLPWAMAFGVEKHWSEAFHGLLPVTVDESSLAAKQSSVADFGTQVIPLDGFDSAVHFSIVDAEENARNKSQWGS